VRRALIAVLVGVSILAVGSSGPAQVPAPANDQAISYLPADNAIVIAVPTDFHSEAFETFDSRVVFPVLGDHVERFLVSWLRRDLGFRGSYPQEIGSQLGGDLMVGLRSRIFLDGWGAVAALQVRDGGAMLRTLRRLRDLRLDGTRAGAYLFAERGSREAFMALDGDVLVFSDSELRLRRALRRNDAGTGMTAELFASRLGDLRQDALIRAVGDVRPLLESRPLRRFLRVPWARALHDARGTVDVVGSELQLDGALDTNPALTREEDLPLQPGDQPPALVRAPGRLSGGSTNQSHATVFLLRAARAAFPRSRFVRRVARVERRLGIDFEQEVLRQFNGPSASLMDLDGGFAARSAVRDPAQLADTMRRLRPYLGGLVKDLQSLETVGLSLLVLFAPDAPVAPVSAATHRRRKGRRGVRVRALPGQRDFYRITGLGGDGPQTIYFGLEGDVFVIGSNEDSAKAMASAPAAAPTEAPGTSVTAAALETLRAELGDLLWFDPGRLGEMSGFLNATVERLRGSLTIELR
jgi:hypothetical protein